jgi:hypothetical protein
MRIFLAGIMQGSHRGAELHDQHYREQLAALLAQYWPHAEIYDPLADHRDSISYDADRGKRVFFHHNRLCREVDLVLAFAPEASMGTAIEMWEAHEHGRAAVVTVSPLVHNWAVRFLSHAVYPDVEALEAALASGELQQRIAEVLAERNNSATMTD